MLGPEETCTGDPARRSGNEFLFQMIAAQNVEVLDARLRGPRPGTRKIVTTCPHCFNTLGREYPQLDGHYEVVHHTQLLNTLVREGRLVPVAAPGRRARRRHLPRPLLPGPAQRGLRRAARARRRLRRAPGGDAPARGPLVLLRRGRRAHVDGGEDRQAGQPGPRRRGAGHRRGEDRHRLPVLPGHAVRRPDPTPERGAGNRGRGPRRRPAPAGRGHARRAPVRTSPSTRSAQAPRGWRPLPCPARRPTARGRRPRSARTPATSDPRPPTAPPAQLSFDAHPLQQARRGQPCREVTDPARRADAQRRARRRCAGRVVGCARGRRSRSGAGRSSG